MFDLILRYRNPILALLLVIHPMVLILVGRQVDTPELGLLGGSLVRTISTTQSVSEQAVGGIGDIWSRYVRLVEVNEENERLRRDVARLEEERVRLLGVMQENARLRAMVGFQVAEPRLQLRAARVIARDITPYFRVARIRLEVGDGIAEPNQPVVAPSGLVGQVTTVVGDYCDVMLTVDTQSSIDVLVQRNRARGILRGLGHENDYYARIAYLLERDEVRPGDVVVTSGLAGRFPSELVVGHVIEVVASDVGLYQEVIVRPSVDFSRLEEVFLITGAEDF